MRRRTFLLLLGGIAVSGAARKPLGEPEPSSITLLNAPLEVQGDWGKSLPGSAAAVVSRMREVCLAGVRLLSDRQPSGLRVEDRTSGPPNIYLHNDPSSIAWIVVDVRGNFWIQLAYQFGHELGHVLANSWAPDSQPRPPCQWLEESLVEAFSLRGLGKLADSWEQQPVFNDAPYANDIRQYRRNVIENYKKMGSDEMRDSGLAVWFRENRSALEKQAGLAAPGQAAVPTMVHELEANPSCVEDIGALNRWPERTAVPIEQYLRRWEKSCEEIGAAGGLPRRLVDLLSPSQAEP